MWASKDEFGFTYLEGAVDCVLEINKIRLSGRGQRERSRWKAILEELKNYRLVETKNGKEYTLTKEGFRVADLHAPEYDTLLNPHYYLDDGVSGERIVEIKKALESLVDTSWVKTYDDHMLLMKEPWRKFKCNNIILKDERINNPDFGNGLLKVEPYDFYDEGILIAYTGKVIKVILPGIGGEKQTKSVFVDVTFEVPYRTITAFDEEGSVNFPYPTLYCQFKNGNPYEGIWYIDKETRHPYKESEIVDYGK